MAKIDRKYFESLGTEDLLTLHDMIHDILHDDPVRQKILYLFDSDKVTGFVREDIVGLCTTCRVIIFEGQQHYIGLPPNSRLACRECHAEFYDLEHLNV